MTSQTPLVIGSAGLPQQLQIGDILNHFAINVCWYGAKGDGYTDDTAAITAAIGAIPASGGTLYFPAGNYITSGGFTLSYPTQVVGDGIACLDLSHHLTQITCTSSTAVLFTCTADLGQFSKVALVCTAAIPSAGSAVLTDGAAEQRIDFDTVFISGFYDNIDVKTGEAWQLVASTIIDPIRYALRIRNTANVDFGDWLVSGNYFAASARSSTAAIYIESSGGGKISNNKINGTPGSSIGFVNGIVLNTVAVTGQLLIVGNDIENTSSAAINIPAGWPYIMIEDNYIACGTIGAYSGPAITITGINNLFIGGGMLIAATAATYAISLSSCFLTTLDVIRIGSNYTFAIDPASISSSEPLLGINDLTQFAPPLNYVVGPVDPKIAGAAATVFPATNDCIASPFQVSRPVNVTHARFQVGTSAGNVDIGIYVRNQNQARFDRIAHTGSTACPGTGLGNIAFLAGVNLFPGVFYLAAIAADDGTATVFFQSSATVANLNSNFGNSYKTSAFPLPSSIADGTTGSTVLTPVIMFV